MRRFRPLLIVVALVAGCAALITIASRAGTSFSGVEYAGTPPHASESADYGKDVVTQGIAPLDPALISAAARDTAALGQTRAGALQVSSEVTPQPAAPQSVVGRGSEAGQPSGADASSGGKTTQELVTATRPSGGGKDRLTIVLPLLLVAVGTSVVYVISKPRAD